MISVKQLSRWCGHAVPETEEGSYEVALRWWRFMSAEPESESSVRLPPAPRSTPSVPRRAWGDYPPCEAKVRTWYTHYRSMGVILDALEPHQREVLVAFLAGFKDHPASYYRLRAAGLKESWIISLGEDVAWEAGRRLWRCTSLPLRAFSDWSAFSSWLQSPLPEPADIRLPLDPSLYPELFDPESYSMYMSVWDLSRGRLIDDFETFRRKRKEAPPRPDVPPDFDGSMYDPEEDDDVVDPTEPW